MATSTTESFPTYVNVDKVEGKDTEGKDRYLVTLLLREEQLEDLKDIAHEYRARRSGRYHALVKSIDEAIEKALSEK
jgi:hypothetical protein